MSETAPNGVVAQPAPQPQPQPVVINPELLLQKFFENQASAYMASCRVLKAQLLIVNQDRQMPKEWRNWFWEELTSMAAMFAPDGEHK